MNDFTTPPPSLEEETGAKTRWPQQSAAPTPVSNEGVFTTAAPLTDEGVSIPEDIAKSAGTQAVFGLGDIVGLPGTMGSLLEQGAQWTGRKALQAGEKLGILPGEHTPETLPAAIGAGIEKAFSAPPETARKDRALRGDVPAIPWPTGEEVEKELRTKIPELEYTPQTPYGEYAGSGARMATSSLAGGPGKTLFGKAGLGAVSGVGAEAAGKLTKGAGFGEYEPLARVAGAILSTGAVSSLANSTRAFTGKNTEAERRLLSAIQDDIRDGTARMTPQQLEEAAQYGHTPSVFDVGGTKTLALISRMGGMAEGDLARYNAAVQARNEAMRTANADYVRDTFGLTERAGATADAMQAAQKATNDKVYAVARSDPNANFVTSFRIEELAKLPAIQKAMKEASELAADPKLDIRPPSATPSFVPGQPAMQTPGNLNFWDHVKRKLDDQISAAYRAGENFQAGVLDNYRKELLGELDSQIGAYKTARATAAEGFGAANALEAGTKFASKPNSYQTQDLIKKIAKLSDDERALFTQGVGDTLMAKAQQMSPQAFAKFISNPENSERLRAALGAERYDQLHGYARSTAMLNNAEQVAAAPVKPSWFTGHYGLTAAIAATLPEIVYLQNLAPGAAAKLAAGYAFDQGLKFIKYKAEQRVAPEVVKLATSSDPADVARLGRLLQTNPAASAFFDRVSNSLSDIALTSYRATAGMQEEPRPQRASGGRIGSINHGAIAASLIRAAEKAKKGHSATTEPLLDQPDEAITKALAIANDAL